MFAETLIWIQQPLRYEQIKNRLEQLMQNPAYALTGITIKGERVDIRFNPVDQRFEIFMDGNWICKVKRADWASHIVITLLDPSSG